MEQRRNLRARRRKRHRVYRVVRGGWRHRRLLLIANLVLLVWGVAAAVMAIRALRRRRQAAPGIHPVPATPQPEQSRATTQAVAGSEAAEESL
jgi:hypothetical protein